MRPASSAAKGRRREDPPAQHQDEGFQAQAQVSEPEPEPEHAHTAAVAIAQPFEVSMTGIPDALAHTTGQHTSDTDDEDEDDYTIDTEDAGGILEHSGLASSSYLNSVTNTPTLAEHLHQDSHDCLVLSDHHPETHIHSHDYDIEMSDSEGGAALEEIDNLTNDNLPFLDIINNALNGIIQAEEDAHAHEDEDEDEEDEEEEQAVGFQYQDVVADSLHFIPADLLPAELLPAAFANMDGQAGPGLTPEAVPQAVAQANGLLNPNPNAVGPTITIFDPQLDDPVQISNPNPNMLGSENLGVIDFLRCWAYGIPRGPPMPHPLRRPHITSIRRQALYARNEISYQDLDGDSCDMQGIDWDDMGTTRQSGRTRRRHTYKNYTNKSGSDSWPRPRDEVRLPDSEDFFRFNRFQLRRDVHLAHFQLRSVLACPTRSLAYYPTNAGVRRMNTLSGKSDLAISTNEFTGLGAMISTLDARHGVLMAGTFTGEYCLQNIYTENRKDMVDGRITTDNNGITNNIQIHTPRYHGSPVAAIASNDNVFRVMDLTTEQFISSKRYPFALNCTAVSPDRRLRIAVGDHLDVLIINAETGEIQQSLPGHRDFGFACDWADDGWSVATGFQDKTLNIWDARYWRDSRGAPKPVRTIRSELAGVRSLKFSPTGSGPKVLVAAEEADYINIIDAHTFESKQTFDVFGEIGGVAFTNEGEDLSILCCDRHRGGILKFERCGGRAGGSRTQFAKGRFHRNSGSCGASLVPTWMDNNNPLF